MSTKNVTVAVLTFRRPAALVAGLLLMLRQIEALAEDASRGYTARIVVVDNDPDASARDVVADLDHPAVDYVVEPTPGIAAARNRALDEAWSSDALVFIDDDERPRAGWLDALVSTWREHGAAAVAGRVVPVYPQQVSDWIVDGGFFVRRTLRTGTRVAAAPTSNILLDVQYLASRGLRFDARLGLGGGEDTMLTRRIVRSGGDIVWCDESVVEDYVPEDRATPKWVLQRAWSHGNTSTNVDLALAPTPGERHVIRTKAVVGGLGRMAAGAAQTGFGAVSGSNHHSARGLRAMFRGAGMTAAAVGVVYHEYAKARRSEAPMGTSDVTDSTV
ncbi:glycosyltransferase family 2 protein [Labedella populi]|uniref:Glycosyltransferase family 2 protein n=1 Tax=Labedella populi TaxID=2498850 RepID=A0A3S5CK26_9MICO|nr:glycosyltransferase family 2 protein [Labedella populi]RWZ61085.1 glycosyltransferase family 2 protein [Labedella populi]